MTVPVAITQPPNTTKITARINGKITDDGGESCEARFRYRTTEITATDTGSWTDFTYPHGFVYYNGYLYATEHTAGDIAKIDPSTLDVSTKVFLASALLPDIIEAGGYLWTMAAVQGVLFKLDPTDLSTEGQWQVVSNGSLVSGALCSDETYIYGTGGRGCFKFKISDSSHSEYEYYGSDKYLHSICEDGDYLYVNDRTDYELVKFQKSDLDYVSSVSTVTGCTDDTAQDDTYVYLGREETSGGVCRVKKSDMTASTFIPDPAIGLSYGVYIVNDGEVDRLLYLDYQNNRIIVFSIPDCTVIQRLTLSGLLDSSPINELVADTNNIYLTQYKAAPAYAATFAKTDIFGGWTTTDWQNTLETNDTYYEDLTDLTAGTEYEFQAQAKNGSGEGEWSDSAYFLAVEGKLLILDSNILLVDEGNILLRY